MFTCFLLSQETSLGLQLLTPWQPALGMRTASHCWDKGLDLYDLMSLLNYNLHFFYNGNDSADFEWRNSKNVYSLVANCLKSSWVSCECLQRDQVLGRVSYFSLFLKVNEEGRCRENQCLLCKSLVKNFVSHWIPVYSGFFFQKSG